MEALEFVFSFWLKFYQSDLQYDTPLKFKGTGVLFHPTLKRVNTIIFAEILG